MAKCQLCYREVRGKGMWTTCKECLKKLDVESEQWDEREQGRRDYYGKLGEEE